MEAAALEERRGKSRILDGLRVFSTFWLLWRSLLVDRFAVHSSNPCRHGRAFPGHPRRAAPRTSSASARPAGRRTVARLFALACVDALGLRGWPGQARPLRLDGAVGHLRHAPDSSPTTANAIRARILALMALSVGRPVCCSFVEPLPSWPGLSRPSTPGRRKTSPASARPAGRRTVARLFALACVDALGLRGWPGQARP